jgi:hypothetical protein
MWSGKALFEVASTGTIIAIATGSATKALIHNKGPSEVEVDAGHLRGNIQKDGWMLAAVGYPKEEAGGNAGVTNVRALKGKAQIEVQYAE